jgi:sensor domain CHASE-containing protein|tara:strand:+ start:426 stop:713 length:288 start_codon:yes stop_codon:yes gene_type:complete
MASNSRGLLLLGGGVMIAAAAIVSTNSGDGWIIPMAILLSIISVFLIFSLLTSEKIKSKGSTPFTSDKSIQSRELEQVTENLPDPADSGIDLPIL